MWCTFSLIEFYALTFVNFQFHFVAASSQVSNDELVVIVSTDVREGDALGEGVEGGQGVIVRVQPLLIPIT